MLIQKLAVYTFLIVLSCCQLVLGSVLYNLHRRRHVSQSLSSDQAARLTLSIFDGLYNQSLDHFDESNNLTWQQVNTIL